MDDTKIVYGIRFPLPARMRDRTKENQYSQIKNELYSIMEKMDKATTYSITLNNLSIEAQQALYNLGYTVIAVEDQHGAVLSFKIEWYNDKEKEKE